MMAIENRDGDDSGDSDGNEDFTFDSDQRLPPYEPPQWQQTTLLAQPPFSS